MDGLGLDVLEAVWTESGNLSGAGPNRANIDAEILQSLIDVDINAINLPLIGDGTNDGLLDLGDAAAAGTLNGYAAAPDETSATAASGAVGADGALDLDAGSSTDLAQLDLTALLGQVWAWTASLTRLSTRSHWASARSVPVPAPPQPALSSTTS